MEGDISRVFFLLSKNIPALRNQMQCVFLSHYGSDLFPHIYILLLTPKDGVNHVIIPRSLSLILQQSGPIFEDFKQPFLPSFFYIQSIKKLSFDGLTINF